MENNVVNFRLKQRLKLQGILRLSKIISILLSFLLSVILVTVTVLLVIKWGFFSPNAYYKNLLKTGYYDEVKKDIYRKAEVRLLSSGLPEDVFEDTVGDFEVHRGVNGSISKGLEGERYLANTKGIREKLAGNIHSYLHKMAIEPDQEQRKSMEILLNDIEEMYQEAIRLPLFNKLFFYSEKYEKIYYIGIISCCFILWMLLNSLIKINRWIHCFLKYITFSTIAAAMMTTIAPAILFTTKIYRRVPIAPQYLFDFTVEFIANILYLLLCFSALFAVISIVLLVMIRIKKTRLVI